MFEQSFGPYFLIQRMTGLIDGLNHRSTSAAKHSYYRSICVKLTYSSEKLRKIRPSEMCYRRQTSEQRLVGYALEVALAYVQQNRSKIEFLVKLCDENVGRNYVLFIRSLEFSQYVDHPFELSLGSSHPQKVDFLASQTLIQIRLVYDVFQYRGKRSHSYSPADHNTNVIFVPVLGALPVRTVDSNLGQRRLDFQRRIYSVSNRGGPRADGSDVNAEIGLVGRRR